MKKESIKLNNVAEIEKKVSELKEKMRVVRFAGAGSRPKNVKEVNSLRKEIARLETTKTELVSTKK